MKSYLSKGKNVDEGYHQDNVKENEGEAIDEVKVAAEEVGENGRISHAVINSVSPNEKALYFISVKLILILFEMKISELKTRPPALPG